MTPSYVNLIISFNFFFQESFFSFFLQALKKKKSWQFSFKRNTSQQWFIEQADTQFHRGRSGVSLIWALNSQLMYLGIVIYAFTRRHL